MGIWNFVKGAGKSVFNKKDAEPNKDDLLAEIAALGLEAEGLDVTVEGDKVKVSGTASQEMKEKVILAVGNVEGIASVEDEISGADPVFHEVKKGETLWGISKDTLGNGNRYMEIFDANKPMLSHPDKIYPGQNLRIPQDISA
ncbi:peptidoglycan-binding protein LysM [Pacificibacter marinus]|jgi:nucleoid-associated protein YgaU|uniref:LysM domain/BON superfamily protein n=1 Tax=Pacificibacter marinus TaxID=658057 RepID=A0A1Y5TSP1_9RHOB|nr:peptidoglycan-binding protein LysM [Pacificibacter marinus]SEL36351.1 BON domain-containing protein [Pacificibacter marinus]SLN69300.1 LysM domain/BON superfamily protein [Pacificibacter marinus]